MPLHQQMVGHAVPDYTCDNVMQLLDKRRTILILVQSGSFKCHFPCGPTLLHSVYAYMYFESFDEI
jgi:hypothetical protein